LGTRFAIVRGSACVHTALPDPWPCPASAIEIQNYVRQQSILLGLGSVGVSTAWTAKAGCTASPFNGPGCLVTVTVTYPFQFLIPFVSSNPISMVSASQMAISQ
jgi:hypothetical protein